MALVVTSQIVSAAPASTSFTTDIAVVNYDGAAVQVVYSGNNGTNNSVKLQGGINGTDFSDLLTVVTTFTTAATSILFNVTPSMGYNWLRVVYVAGNASAGTLNVYSTRKSI